MPGTGTALADVVISDLEVTVPAADAGAAVEACRPLTERTGALVRGVVRVRDDDEYDGESLFGESLFEVRLARTEALAPGETAAAGLARVNRRLLDALGRTEEVTPDHPRRMSGVSFVDEDGALLPAGTFVSTVVRMSDVEDPFEGYERLEPEWPDGGASGLDGPAAAELMAVVQAMTWTKIVLIAHIVGRAPVEAREELRALVTGVDHEVFLAQPEPDGDAVRVWAVLGMAAEPAARLFEQAVSALSVTGWTVREPDSGEEAGAVAADWVPEEPPAVGVTRLELRIGVAVIRYGEEGLALSS